MQKIPSTVLIYKRAGLISKVFLKRPAMDNPLITNLWQYVNEKEKIGRVESRQNLFANNIEVYIRNNDLGSAVFTMWRRMVFNNNN